MEFLKNRRLALVVLAAVILLATPFGMWRSLTQAVHKVEAGFEKGVTVRSGSTSYHSNGFTKYLEAISMNALGLASAVDNTAAETMLAARSAIYEVKTPAEKVEAAAKLNAAVEALARQVQSLPEEKYNKKNWDNYYEDYTGAFGAAARELSEYNRTVEEFCRDVMGKFPASLISGIFSIEPPARLGDLA